MRGCGETICKALHQVPVYLPAVVATHALFHVAAEAVGVEREFLEMVVAYGEHGAE